MSLKKISQQVFIIGSMVFCAPTFSVVGPILNQNNNPKFSCAVFSYVLSNDNDINLTSLCSGEVISKRWFLTAGHCINTKDAFIICPNIQNKLYPVIESIIHPHYDGGGTPYDQALLQVEQDFPFNPVHLPQSADEVTFLLKKECAIFGYGLNSEGKAGTLLGISTQFNGAFFGQDMVGLGSSTYPRQGDSGAGLLCREKTQNEWIRVGTVSLAEIGLGNAALLSPSLSWISKTIQKKQDYKFKRLDATTPVRSPFETSTTTPKINYSCMCDPDTEYTNDIPKRLYAQNSYTVEEATKKINQACLDRKPGKQNIKLFACFCKENGTFFTCH